MLVGVPVGCAAGRGRGQRAGALPRRQGRALQRWPGRRRPGSYPQRRRPQRPRRTAPVRPVRAWRNSTGRKCCPPVSSSRGVVQPLPAAAGGFPRARGSYPQCPPPGTADRQAVAVIWPDALRHKRTYDGAKRNVTQKSNENRWRRSVRRVNAPPGARRDRDQGYLCRGAGLTRRTAHTHGRQQCYRWRKIRVGTSLRSSAGALGCLD